MEFCSACTFAPQPASQPSIHPHARAQDALAAAHAQATAVGEAASPPRQDEESEQASRPGGCRGASARAAPPSGVPTLDGGAPEDEGIHAVDRAGEVLVLVLVVGGGVVVVHAEVPRHLHAPPRRSGNARSTALSSRRSAPRRACEGGALGSCVCRPRRDAPAAPRLRGSPCRPRPCRPPIRRRRRLHPRAGYSRAGPRGAIASRNASPSCAQACIERARKQASQQTSTSRHVPALTSPPSTAQPAPPASCRGRAPPKASCCRAREAVRRAARSASTQLRGR
eukprot:scaffold1581_cov342-Prasinococcus_capsulatus_cf.AAC.20